MIAAGLLRGLKDTKIPMYMAIVSYLVVGITVAYVLAFPMGLEGPGVWAGLAIGLTLAAGLMGGRYIKLMRGVV